MRERLRLVAPQRTKLILKLGATGEAGCAHALQALTDTYEYDALTRLLDEHAAGKGVLL